MIGQDPELERLIAPLRDGPVALRSAEEAQRRRERFVHAVRAQTERVPSMRRQRRVVQLVMRAAALNLALLACAFGGWLAHGYREGSAGQLQIESAGGPLVWIDAMGVQHTLAGPAQLSHTGELQVPANASAHMVTRDQVRIDVGSASRLRIGHQRERGSHVFLARGEVRCQVPRLAEGHEFAVGTPAARIVVHGTEFSIRVRDSERASTCVRVREGLVEVQQGTTRSWLGPGASWGCEDELASPEPQAKAAPERASAEARGKGARRVRTPERAGTLEAENRLLAAALRAERAGDRVRARRLFARLLRVYAESPLVPEAEAGLARLR